MTAWKGNAATNIHSLHPLGATILMPRLTTTRTCRIPHSFRTAQIAGMFDVPLADKLQETFAAELPGLEEAWQIGLIVGPSGSGKSTIAARAFGNRVYSGGPWPRRRAVIDCLGEASTRHLVRTLTAVGLSSPPSWVKPYRALSTGQQFRCDLARALLQTSGEPSSARKGARAATRRCRLPHSSHSSSAARLPLLVFDEFTSVVDRNVARVCSAAIAKQIHAGQLPVRFVAVTCHYDVAPWLEADWMLDMATGQVSRRRLRRPRLRLRVWRSGRAAWELFKRHHYLSGSLAAAARCYLAVWQRDPLPGSTAAGVEEVPVAFAATIPILGRRGHRRFTRIVVLPDYQGIGIGMRFTEAVAALHRREGLRINLTTSHPAVIGHCRSSGEWRTVAAGHGGRGRVAEHFRPKYRGSAGRAVVSFEYHGGGAEVTAS